MYKKLRHIAIFCFLLMIRYHAFAVEGKPTIRRACLDYTDSTITLLWFQPTDNCNSFTWFSVYGRESPLSLYKHMGRYTNFALNSVQFKIPNLKDWEFYIVYSKACNGTDSIFSDTLMIDNQLPANSIIDSVSVDLTTQQTHIGWKQNPSKDVKGYKLYYFTANTNIIIDNTTNTSSVDIDPSRKPTKAPFSYKVAAYDSCNNTSLISSEHTTIFLNSTYDQCKKTIDLSWTPYLGWAVQSYNIYLSINGGSYQFIGNVISNISKFTYNFSNFGDQYCFYLRALKQGENITSTSNITCISSNSLIQTSNSYIAKVSVQQDAVELTFVTQVGTSMEKINIYKEEDNKGFLLWQTVNFTGGTIELIDKQVKVHSKNYSYYFTTEGICNLVFDTSQVCKTILLKLDMIAAGNQNLNWSTYSQFKKNTEKQELLLINSPNSNKSSPWNMVNTFPPSVVFANDLSNFSASMQQLCYCLRAIENPTNQFYRRQDTSYSNIECATADPIVYFPNAIQISGFNTAFFPEGVFLDFDKSSFQVFNRWGQLVYETHDIRKGWDGKIQNGDYIEEEVYAYRAIIIGINGKQLIFDGTVTVLK